jgi:hypothetical protein
MTQEQQKPRYWALALAQDAINARAAWSVDANRACLAGSRALLETCRETASTAQARGNAAVRTATVIAGAGLEASFDQLERIAETRDLQKLFRLQMLWGPNQLLAICHALTGGGGERPDGRRDRAPSAGG